jgi:2-C-methyl-D-erythritol 2,4-cyclodiphosphate synthase
MYRIGLGTDLHRLENGHHLILGGVIVPSDKGTVAHSDGDVLLHAIIDALLGAISVGDIGDHFPPTDMKYHNISSSQLLQHVLDKFIIGYYKIINLDTTISLEKPKLLEIKNSIRKNIANILSLEENQVSIKAKTHEGVDAVGLQQAIMAHAVVLLKKIK